MGGKHLKKLRAERAKVQLKKKKTLEKAQNVTDTRFKAKKIVTAEQLKKVDENEPVSLWKVPLKDLLSRLSHHNCTTRQNNLTGLKELITNYPQILEGPSLRDIIIRVLELLIDLEHKIRMNAISFLQNLFGAIPAHYLISFHDILIVHINCAMTHRESGIQQDSLQFVNVMIKYAPEAVKKNFPTLVQNFTRILKNYNYRHNSEKSGFKKTKQDLEKSKCKVLLRFYQLLSTVYSHESTVQKNVEFEGIKGRFDIKKLCNLYKRMPSLSLHDKSKTCQFISAEHHSEEIKSYISHILPLLFDTWTEFAPSQKNDDYTSECLLSDSIAELLLVILEIFLLLYETAQKTDNQLRNWFISTYKSKFINSFMPNFPYLPRAHSSRPFNIVGINSTQKSPIAYMTQNLIISYLYISFKNKSEEIPEKVEKYILESIRKKNPSGMGILAKVIELILNPSKIINFEDIISSVVKVYQSTNNQEFRQSLFNILARVSLSEEYSNVYDNSHLKNWMQSLPLGLMENKISYSLVETIIKLINRECGRDVLRVVEENAQKIAANLPMIEVEGKTRIEGQKLISNILYRCENSVLRKLIEDGILQQETYSQELREYINNIISYKLRT